MLYKLRTSLNARNQATGWMYAVFTERDTPRPDSNILLSLTNYFGFQQVDKLTNLRELT